MLKYGFFKTDKEGYPVFYTYPGMTNYKEVLK